MASFRFETYENLITKHTLKQVHWTQAAQSAFYAHSDKSDWTLASVRQIDADTIEVVKRKDQNKGLIYKLGFDQHGLFERVIINRKEHSVAVDRLDANWLDDAPFLGSRDLFMPSKRGGDGSLDFVRHNFWIHKLTKMPNIVWSSCAAWCYRRSFRCKEPIKPWQ